MRNIRQKTRIQTLFIFLTLSLSSFCFSDTFVKHLPLTNATAYDPAVEYFVSQGSSIGGTTGYIEAEYGHIYHTATIATYAASSWGWARIGIDVQDGIISDAFTVNSSGKYKLVLTGTLNGSIIEGSTSAISWIPAEGKTTGSLYISGRLAGESAIEPDIIKKLHEYDHGWLAFLNDAAVSSCKNIIDYFGGNIGLFFGQLYDVLIALDKSKEWNNEPFRIVSYNYLEAGQSYKWSFLVRSVQGSAQLLGGTGAALYELNVTNLSADLYSIGIPLNTVSASSGLNGTITPGSAVSVASGEDIEFSAMPSERYMVDKWTEGGFVKQDGGQNYTVKNVQSNVNVHVDFKLIPVPDDPSNLSTTAVSSNRIDLIWNDNSSNEDGFKICRSNVPASGYVEIGTVGPEVESYVDSGLTSGKRYYYRIYAYNDYGLSYSYAYSNAATDGGVSDFTASDGRYSNKVLLQWPPFGSIGSYDVYGYSLKRNGQAIISFPNLLSSATTSYEDTNVQPGVIYNYTLGVDRSEGGGIIGSHQVAYYSDTGYALPLITPPSLPTYLWAAAGLDGQYIDIAWSAVDGADDYRIYRSETANLADASLIWFNKQPDITDAEGNVVTWRASDIDASPGVMYNYWICAIKNVGEIVIEGDFAGPEFGYLISEDDYEPDDQYDQATTIEIDSSGQAHNLDVWSDIDWLKFDVTQPMNIIIVVDMFGRDSTGLRTELYGPDSHSNYLANAESWDYFGYDCTVLTISRRNAQALSPGTYFIKCCTKTNVYYAPGEYWLKVIGYPVNPAELSGDSIVNLKDFSIFANQWQQSGTYSADIAPAPNGDGTVNILDLIEFAEHWLTSSDGTSSPDTPVKFFSEELNSDPGWGTEGEWQFGIPLGQGGTYGNPDPTSGYTGDNVYGINLGGDCSMTGGTEVVRYLTSSAINCTGYSNVQLKYARWMNMPEPMIAPVSVEVSNDNLNWNSIWINDAGANFKGMIFDNDWVNIEHDISQYADNQSSIYIRWGYSIFSDLYPESGWNIDHVELWGVPE